MGEPAHRPEAEVIAVTDYLREMITQIDEAIAEMTIQRNGLAIRLAVIEASEDPKVRSAADDYDQRVRDGVPFDARAAEGVLGEAWKRFTS